MATYWHKNRTMFNFFRKYFSKSQKAMYFSTLLEKNNFYLIFNTQHYGFCQTNKKSNFMPKIGNLRLAVHFNDKDDEQKMFIWYISSS